MISLDHEPYKLPPENYCSCGVFISFDVRNMQTTTPKKCLSCGLKESIEILKNIKGDSE